MYEFIKGILVSIQATYIVVENHGIGYQIHVPNPYKFQTNLQQDVTIYIEQVVREDSNTLYGFENLVEKQLFLHLNTVKNIGPRTAMSILAVDDHQGLVTAIHQKDVTYLTKFPGIGKRTAQQMLLDLEGKLDFLADDEETITKTTADTALDTTIYDETLEALAGLGYSQREINRIEKLLKQESFASTQEALSFAFKLLIK